MALCEKLGHDDVSGRDLFLLSISRPEDFPHVTSLSTPRFVCLLAWDASAAGVEQISALARRLLDAGAVYICAWGPDCERVHDIIDEEDLGPHPAATADSVVMTTWHAGESLDDALQFVLTGTVPDAAYSEGCGSTLAVAIGSAQWAEQIRAAFSRRP